MSSYTIKDDRTPDEVDQTAAFVIATDSFMSGWGNAPARSIVARAIPMVTDSPNMTAQHGEMIRVFDLFDADSNYKRVRVVYGKEYKPRLQAGDHLHIYGFDSFNYA